MGHYEVRVRVPNGAVLREGLQRKDSTCRRCVLSRNQSKTLATDLRTILLAPKPSSDPVIGDKP